MAKDEGSDSMRMWGATCRCLRLAAGLSHDQLAEYVGYSKSLVVGIERGLRMPSDTFIVKADEATHAGGLLIQAAAHLSRQQYPLWFEEYAEAEKRALTLWSYGANVIHGLLQTEPYMCALLAARCPILEDDEITARVEARLTRQELLTRKPACALSFVIEEANLRRLWGDTAAMKGQLEHLIELSERRNIAIQIMPTARQHAGHDGPLTLVETPEHSWLAYVETQGNSQLIHETDRVSVLHQRYSMMRSQALGLTESIQFIERVTGEL